MKKDKKILFIIGIALIIQIIGIVLILKYVTFNNTTTNNKEIEAKVLEGLKERYNKDFNILKVYNRQLFASYINVDTYPKEDPDLIFNVGIDINDENFSDNYVERYICKQIENQIYTNIGKTGGVFVRVNGVGPQPITYDLNQTIEEYNALDPLNSFKVTIFTTNENAELYDRSKLFLGLEYLDISGKLYYNLSNTELKKIQDILIKDPERSDTDFKKLLLQFNYEDI